MNKLKKTLKIVFFTLVAGFILIQFFQPERNKHPITSDDIFNQLEISDNIKNILQNSCYDCHSNQTKYPWYNNIAPVSWMLADHIKEGKEHLNFSEWGKLSKRKKIGALSEICEVCEENEMPLKGYVIMHKSTKLSKVDIKNICEWTERASQQILTKKSTN